MKDNNINKMYQYRKQQDDYCKLEDISPYLIKYILLLEDKNFYKHGAVNLEAIKDAFKNNLKGGRLMGGSTITQQLVKNIYFRFEANYFRKALEILLAQRFEKTLSKDEILELYLNTIYFDNGQYGIVNACKFYFNKKPSELTYNQAYFLARILPIVGIYNPFYHPKDFLRFKKYCLEEIYREKDISEQEYQEIIRHNETCLDEELCKPTKETKKYDAIGPMINERFGPGQKESLLEAIKRI